MPRIQANRDQVDDRFSVLGFTIRTESPLFEVAVATDPALFRADARGRRGRRNFYSSRAQGVLRARRGEAVYLLPQDVLANFVGQPKLYFGLATYRDGTPQQPDFVQLPQSGNMYVSLSGLSERGLRRAVGSFNGSSYGQAGAGRDPSLEWGGDSAAARPATGAGATPAPASGAPVNPPPAGPVAAGLDYDDGFGPFPPPQSSAQGDEGVQAYRNSNGNGSGNVDGGEPCNGCREPGTQAMDIPLDPGAGGRSIGVDAMQAGDIIVSTTRAWVSRAIRLGTLSPVSHVMLYLGGGRVIEAVGSGVREVTVEAALHDAILAVAYRVPNLSATQRERVLSEARQFKDQPYNYPGIVQRGVAIVAPVTGAVVDAIARVLSVPRPQAHAVYCSQLVLEAYQRAGITLLAAPASQSTPEGVARFAQGRLGYVGHLKAEDVPLGIQFAVDEDEPDAQAPAQAQSWVEPQEVLLRAYNGTLGDQIRLFADTVKWVAGVDDTHALPHSAIGQVLCYNGDRMIGKATAFFIAPRLLLTNAHVVSGCTKLVIIPGKTGDGAGSEPFGRFETTTWRAHPSYRPGRRDFDFAVVLAPRNAPGGHLSPVEELTQSRPEGVAVCGYSARSRRDDPVGTIVNAVLNPDKQHVHRGYVREISDEVMHYDVQELAGSSGSPVYWIEGGATPRVHVVGVNAGPRDGLTNSGVRLTRAKVQWIRERAAELGQSVSFAAEGGEEEYAGEQALSADDDARGIEGAQPEGHAGVGAQALWAEPMGTTAPQYPLARRFVQAATGNYRPANRGRADIQRIVIHITDGCTTGHCRTDAERARAINGTISWFQDPAARVSAHYIVGQDGEVVQMVRHEDVAYHAHTANSNSIGIEHVADAGHRGHVRTAPSRLQLEASAALVTWLCDRFGITPDRAHILGHSEVDSGTTHADCPNAVWDWDTYMRLVTSRQCLAQGLAAQGMSDAGAQGLSLDAGGPVLVPAPAPVMQQPLALSMDAASSAAPAAPAGPQRIASTVNGAQMWRVSTQQGARQCQLDQLRGYKHPGDTAPASPAAFQDGPTLSLTDWPRLEGARGDVACLGIEVRWQHNGRSLGQVRISPLAGSDAAGWHLHVKARIFDDAHVYAREEPSFAALRVRLEYCFTPDSGAVVHAFRELHLFGNGRYNIGGDWAQYRALPLEHDGGVAEPDERLNQTAPGTSVAESLEVAARTVAPTAPSRFLQAALSGTSGVRHAVLAAAARELGVREIVNSNRAAGGDATINDDPEGRIVAYLRECGLSATTGRHNSAYCAAFTTFALRSGGYTGVRGSAGAGNLRAQFEQAGRYHAVEQSRPYDPAQDFRPRPGDVFFTGSPGRESHAGLVVSVDDNGTLHTLEGNTWSPNETTAGVMERNHAAANKGRRYALVGFGSLLDDAAPAQAHGLEADEAEALQAQTPRDPASLSWESARYPDRASWSRELLQCIRAHKAELDQGNPESYLAGYNQLDAAHQLKFWGELMVAMAQFESSWNPHSRYREANGQYSVGLFQLSYANARDYAWEPISEERASLEDPLVNIRCAVIVLAHLVAQNRVVASSEGGRHQGGARYWSVLRAGARHKFNEIREYVRTHVPMP